MTLNRTAPQKLGIKPGEHTCSSARARGANAPAQVLFGKLSVVTGSLLLPLCLLPAFVDGHPVDQPSVARAEALKGTVTGTLLSSYASSDVVSRGLMATVRAYKSSDSGQVNPVASVSSSAAGSYSLKLPPGSYVLRVDTTVDYRGGYYSTTGTASSFAEATVISVKAGKVYSNLNMMLQTRLVDLADASPSTDASTVQLSEPSGLAWNSHIGLLYYVGDEDKTHVYALEADGSDTERFSTPGSLNDTEALLWQDSGAEGGMFTVLTSQAASSSSGNDSQSRQRIATFALKDSEPTDVQDSSFVQVDFADSDGELGSFKQLLVDALTARNIPLSPKGVNVEGFAPVGGTAPQDQWLVGLKDPLTPSGQAILMLVQGMSSLSGGNGNAQVVGYATVELYGQGFSDLSADPIHPGQFLFTSGTNDFNVASDPRPRIGTLSFSGLLTSVKVTEVGMTQDMHHPEGIARIVWNPSVPSDPSNQQVGLVFDDENGSARFARFLTLTIP